MRKINIFTVFLIAVLILVSLWSPSVSALSDPDIDAEAALLVESTSGTILYEKNIDVRASPGSIAKIMVLLLSVLAVEDGQVGLKDKITASDTFLEGLSEGVAVQDIKPGETMSYQDLMYCAYLASANDACNILAETVAGSIPAFVKKMNDKAQELGCSDTHFSNPGGLTDPGQYTSAWDQYLIFKEAVGHPLFLQIARTESYDMKADDDSPDRSLINPNLMLRAQNDYFYPYCAAGKTATLSEYGSSLVSVAIKSDMSLVSVVFGVKSGETDDASSTARSFIQTTQLFEWGFSSFAWRDIVSDNEIAAIEEIVMGKGADEITLKPADTISVLVRSDLTVTDIERDILIYGISDGDALSAPVKEGDVLGEMTVSVDGTVRGKVSLLASQNVDLDRGAYIKSEIKETLSILWVQCVIFVLILLFGLYIWLVIRDGQTRRARRQRIEDARRKIIEERQKQKIVR